MLQAELLKIVKGHKGRIYMNVTGPVDGMSVQVLKVDLVWKLEDRFEADEETNLCATKLDGYLYLDSASML